ncbi:MAG TPA: TolC family protein [Candidatus Polarisedimenticolia bacterium]|jgi:outer membrane protein TolC|nr:TolC family protein [Candidatus Polarisedimenticolia bacterium]
MKRFSRGVLVVVLCVAFSAAGGPPLPAQEPPPPAAPEPGTPTLLEYQSAPGTLSLQEVLKSALEKNLSIAVRRFDPKIAETNIETEKAFFSPLLDLSARKSENNQPGSSALSGGNLVTDRNRSFAATYNEAFEIGSRFQFNVFTNRTSTNNTFSTVNPSYFSQALATYTQSFLRNFGLAVNRTGIVIAQNNEKISRSQFRQTVIETLAAAEKAYWALQFAIMDQKAKEASLKLAQDFLEQTRIKVKVGTLPPIEITQAEAQVADQEEGIITGLAAIRLAEDNLRRLMNIATDSPLWHQPIQPTDEPQVLDKIVNEDEAMKTALEKRPDLEQARLDLANRDASVRFQKNQKLYRLDLVAQYGAQGLAGTFLPVQVTFVTGDPGTPPGCVPIPSDPTLCTATVDPPDLSRWNSYSQIKDRDFNTWSAELQLGIPLGNRAANAAYAQSKYLQDQSKLTIEQLEQSALVEVRNAVRQIETDLKRVKAAQVNTRLQLEKLSAEQKKYENGMSTAFQVLTFQTDLTSARRRENLAIVDYNTALVELDRVLGILLDTRDVTIAN